MNFKAIILNLILGLSLVNTKPVKAELFKTAMYSMASFVATYVFIIADRNDLENAREEVQWLTPTALVISARILFQAKKENYFEVALLATIAGYIAANS